MELVKNQEDCCGCRTCEKVCPKGAIRMEADECGFLYPNIDASKCIDCGLCLKKCAFQSGYKKRKEYEPFYGYGARHKDEKVFMNSRSGGAFIALSDQILAKGGSIYGAGYDEEKRYYCVRHKRAVTKQERDEFTGSKYVQSDLANVFPEIKEELETGKQVLFSGTGCQVGALYAYLGKEYENLYTIDIVCHGTPSPKVWEDFLHMREKELHGKIENVEFRNKKKYGWKAHYETVWINGKEYSSRIYSRLFSKGMSRPSCYQCIYANKNRVGDITIADFWGHEKALGDQWDDDKGISLVLVNNAQGMRLWEQAKEDLDYVDSTGYPYRHTNMKRPTTKPEHYEEFWEDYKKKGFAYCAEKYADYKVQSSWKNKIKNFFGKK